MTAPALVRAAGLVALNLWVAWRYSYLPIGQDEGIWMLWGFTGARPYLDYVDCKPPGIYLWLWLLAKLSGKKIRLTKFFEHTTLGGFAVAAYLLSGDLNAGLLFTALAQSAWLLAYHAPMEPISAGFFLLALLLRPWPATVCLALAVLFNLKLGPSAVLLLLLRGWWPELLMADAVTAVLLGSWYLLWPTGFRAAWYGCITVSRRLVRKRRQDGQGILPRWDGYLVRPMLIVIPAVSAAVLARPDPVLWAVAVTYASVNLLGRVWRPYHWIPLSAMAAAAAPSAAVLILLTDWISNGLYLGSIIGRIQPLAAFPSDAARSIGEDLRPLPGILWVEDECTQIYIYARKRPPGAVEQVEIRHVIPERRYKPRGGEQRFDLLVLGPDAIPFTPRGFRRVFAEGPFTALARAPDAQPAP